MWPPFRHTSIAASDGGLTHSCTLELGVEALVVTGEPLDQLLLTSLSYISPRIIRRRGSAIAVKIGVRFSEGTVPSDLVGDGVDEVEAFRKGAGGDLVIVVFVAPSPEILDDWCAGELGVGIYEAEHNISIARWRM